MLEKVYKFRLNPTKSNKEGFTLIELIAVLAILAVLAAILIPNIVGYINKAKQGKVISDAGVIISSIDAYETENADKIGAIIYTNPTESSNEDKINLIKIISLDKDKEIIGGSSPVKKLPVSFGGDNGNDIPISVIRGIAQKDIIVELDISGKITYYYGDYNKADGTSVSIDKDSKVPVSEGS